MTVVLEDVEFELSLGVVDNTFSSVRFFLGVAERLFNERWDSKKSYSKDLSLNFDFVLSKGRISAAIWF